MKIEINSDNFLKIKGHVSRLNLYPSGKAMNITVAVHKPDSDNDNFITLKSFDEAQFKNLTIGMKVEIWGEIGSASYKDPKTGETCYHDNNDLIAKNIIYDETKKTTVQREAMRAFSE
jgi:hypothetical protein